MEIKTFHRKLNTHLVPATLTIIFLLVATFSNFDYGGYQLLRLIVCATSILFAVTSPPSKFQIERYTFILIAILFNPVLKVSFGREIWQFVDVAVALVFVYFLLRFWWGPSTIVRCAVREFAILLGIIGLGVAMSFSSRLFPTTDTNTRTHEIDVDSLVFVLEDEGGKLILDKNGQTMIDLKLTPKKQVDGLLKKDSKGMSEDEINAAARKIWADASKRERRNETIDFYLRRLGEFLAILGYPIYLLGRLAVWMMKRKT